MKIQKIHDSKKITISLKLHRESRFYKDEGCEMVVMNQPGKEKDNRDKSKCLAQIWHLLNNRQSGVMDETKLESVVCDWNEGWENGGRTKRNHFDEPKGNISTSGDICGEEVN